jgi:uncharacterized protein YpmB
MPWWAKVVSGLIGIFMTIAGGIYSGLKIFHGEIKEAKEEAIQVAKDGDAQLLQEMNERRDRRDSEIKLRDEKYQAQLTGISNQISDLKFFIGRKIDKQVTNKTSKHDLYSTTELKGSGGKL